MKNILASWNLIFLMFSGLQFYSWIIIETIFSLKNLHISNLHVSKQQIILPTAFIKYNFLKLILVFPGPSLSGSRFFRFWVQGLGLGFRMGLGFSRSVSKVRVQVLEVAFDNMFESLNRIIQIVSCERSLHF